MHSQIYSKINEALGKGSQLQSTIEELSELSEQILLPYKNRDNMLDEVSDCYNMMHQLMHIYSISEVDVKSTKRDEQDPCSYYSYSDMGAARDISSVCVILSKILNGKIEENKESEWAKVSVFHMYQLLE